VDCAGGGLIDP